MRNQTINLNLIPGGVMPVVHLSQFDQDVDGSLIFNIYNGPVPYDLTDCVAHIQGHKPDDTIFDYQCTVHETYITAATEYQMTVMAGQYPAELRISKDGSAVGTLNFIFAVEPSTATGADLSHTDIPELMLEIEQAVVSSGASASASEESAEDSEAWAVGQRNGTDVPDTDPTYHNNSKYYAGQASTSASNAYSSETNAGSSESNAAASERNAEGSAEDSEAWAVGERDGVPVSSDDPTYHNNAKYWSQQSQTASIANLADVTLTNLADGDLLQYDSNSQDWLNVPQSSITPADMTGATAQDAGAHGLVPAPAAGDNSKFLRGDGTWQTVDDASNSTVTFTDASQDGAITSGSPLKTLISLIKYKLTNRSAASGGSDVSLVTTGEKYTWDNKAENMEFTGVTSGPTPGHHGLVPAPTAGYPDQYLRSNGSWSDLPTPDYVDAQYNSSTTYSKGMTCISGNVRYRYINSTASSGHQPPDATYWEVLSVTSQLNEPLTSLEKMLTQSTDELVAIDSVHGLEYKKVTISNAAAGTYYAVPLGTAGVAAIMPWTYAEFTGGAVLNGIKDYPQMLSEEWLVILRDDSSGSATGRPYQYYINIKQHIGASNNIILHLWTIRRTDA